MADPRILLVVAPYYKDIAEQLVAKARARCEAAGAQVSYLDVPGALEIPPAIRIQHARDPFDGYVALGCVIRGQTYHFQLVAKESARGLMTLGVRDGLAIGNGILTVNNHSDVGPRIKKGAEAAEACLALLRVAGWVLPDP